MGSSRSSRVKASLLIPTYGSRLQYLRDELDSLQSLSYPAQDFEIIVIDNGPKDEVAKIVDEYNKNGKHAIRFIKETKPGLGEARHAGARAALGEILVYLDDDVLLPTDWLQWMLEPYKDPRVASVAGKVVLKMEVEPPKWVAHFNPAALSALDFGEKAIELVYPHAPWGCNMSVKKNALYEVGGFNPDFFGDPKYKWWTGDGESGLATKIYAAGHKIMYEPKAWLHHRIPASRCTEQYFYQRAYTTGIMASYTVTRASNGKALLTLRLMMRSVFCFLRALEKYISSYIKPEWKVRSKASALHWCSYGQHQWVAAFNTKLRAYICQERYL